MPEPPCPSGAQRTTFGSKFSPIIRQVQNTAGSQVGQEALTATDSSLMSPLYVSLLVFHDCLACITGA